MGGNGGEVLVNERQHVLVIGAGTAGTRVARTLAGAGLGVTVVDRGELGGTCLWHGCVPKKALYTAAHHHREAVGAARMGFAPGPPDLDWSRLMAWRLEVQKAYAGDQEGMLKRLDVDVVHAPARFVSPTEVAAGGRVIAASQIVVATGSRAIKPGLPGIELAGTSDDALDYEQLPGSLVILGGGYIAMEFAGIYAAFGTRVTVVLRGTDVLRGFDPEAARIARRGLEAAGVGFVTESRTESIEGSPGALTVRLTDARGRPRTLHCQRVLAATGRRPALDDLDLGAGQVEVDASGRPRLDACLRSTSNPRVWVAGDAAGGVELTPVAGLEGEAIAQSILGGRPIEPDLTVVPSTCFTVPEVARVGIGEAELAASGAPYVVARGDFQWVAQAIASDRRGGLVKLLAHRDGRLVGAHLAGPHAGELIYGLAVAVRAGATLGHLQTTRAVHPTLAEALNWAAFTVETIAPQ